MTNIEKNIKEFIKGKGKNLGRNSNERYASFDYCFNYFQQFKENNRVKEIISERNLQQSCLQLGFYLASWGMLRGSSFLLEKSARVYSKLLKEIVGFDKNIWDIDVDSYTEENIDLILGCKERIINSFGNKSQKNWDTLTTKIMLGIFANVPAFDENFKRFLKRTTICQTFNKKSLLGIKEFYDKDSNKKIINKYSKKIHSYDFLSGKETNRNYTKAKIIDMIGFIDGQKNKI